MRISLPQTRASLFLRVPNSPRQRASSIFFIFFSGSVSFRFFFSFPCSSSKDACGVVIYALVWVLSVSHFSSLFSFLFFPLFFPSFFFFSRRERARRFLPKSSSSPLDSFFFPVFLFSSAHFLRRRLFSPNTSLPFSR